MNIFDTAKYILDSVGDRISAMKLQKLCYYAQAWTLAWDGKPLFKEEFLRWDNGPVCKELFDEHRGMFYVDSRIISNDLLSKEKMTDAERRNIDQIIEAYGKHSGTELGEMTHVETPWKDTERNEIISKEIMQKYYSSLIKNEA